MVSSTSARSSLCPTTNMYERMLFHTESESSNRILSLNKSASQQAAKPDPFSSTGNSNTGFAVSSVTATTSSSTQTPNRTRLAHIPRKGAPCER